MTGFAAGWDANQGPELPGALCLLPGARFTANIGAVCLWLLGSEDTLQEGDEVGRPPPVGTVGSLLGVERKWRELQENINPDNALGQGNKLWTCPYCDTVILHVYFWAGTLARYYTPIT